MSQDEPAAVAGIQTLRTTDAHATGTVSAVWLNPKEPGQLSVLTAGADGVLSERQIRPTEDVKWKTTICKEKGVPVNALAVSPDGKMAAVVINHTHVKLLPSLKDINDIHDSRVITKFSGGLHTYCCVWGKDGKHVLAASDDGTVRVVLVPSCKVFAQMKVEGYMRGVAMDPLGQYAAAATADGQLLLWDLEPLKESGGKVKDELKKSITCKVDHDDVTARVGMAWHPDGSLLAVAGQESDVLLLERWNWRSTAYLTGGHTGAVRVIAFSPNGLYVATAGDDCKVVVWLQESKLQVSVRELPAPASSLSWHPAANLLLCGTTAGSFATWLNTVPCNIDPNLPSPYKDLDEVLRNADVAAEAAAAATAAAEADDDDMLDDDEDGVVIRRRGLKHAGGGGAAAGGGDDELNDMLDQLDAAMQEAEAAPRRPAPGALYPSSYAPKPKKPQAPIHPGCTPEEDGEGNQLPARFLAYNALGAVVSKVGDSHNFVEVQFHDTSKHRGLAPKFSEMYGFVAASLGPNGVAFISPAGEEIPSVLMYRAFESWSGEKDWTVSFPAGEEALVVAAGSSVVAVATSKQLLRLYSLAGRQLSIVSLQGPPVALVAAGAGYDDVSEACQHQLAVVWAQGPPEPLHNTQQLAYTVFDTSSSGQVASGGVVLSPGASLSWLAFSTEGLLTAMDSTGVLRVRTPDWGGSWVPVLAAASAKESCGSDSLWPVCLAGDCLTAVVTTKKAPHPQVLPAPLHTQVALSPPGAPAAEAAVEHEAQGILTGVMSAHLTAQIQSFESSGMLEAAADCAEQRDLAHDRLGLKAFKAYCAANKQSRALEVANSLRGVKALEGAVKLASYHNLSRLAENIQAIAEERVLLEQQQAEAAAAAAAAAAEQAAYVVPFDAAAWEGDAAAETAAGDENDMQVQRDQPDEASQFPGAGTSSPKQPAAQSRQQQGGKVPAMFGGKSAAAAKPSSAGGASVAAAVKRTAAAAGFGAGGASKGSNPFARVKKAK